MSQTLSQKGSPVGGEEIDIAVIRLPYLSNYTDFAPLGKTAGVRVRYVSQRAELGTPDLIILPGTKNTIGDLRWLRETGLAEEICAMVRAGGTCAEETNGGYGGSTVGGSAAGGGLGAPLLMGICGGYQMLGERILDPLGSETGGAEKGLGLLPVETVFREEKYTRQRSGRTRLLTGPWTALSDLPVSGYEIHMGDTEYLEKRTAGELQNGLRAEGQDHGEVFASLGDSQEKDGAVCGGVLGTYLHGIFDEPELRSALVNLLSERKKGARGAGTKAAADSAADAPESARLMQERQLDLLADVLRESLDWELIYRTIGI